MSGEHSLGGWMVDEGLTSLDGWMVDEGRTFTVWLDG